MTWFLRSITAEEEWEGQMSLREKTDVPTRLIEDFGFWKGLSEEKNTCALQKMEKIFFTVLH